jgi:hypothetical protein
MLPNSKHCARSRVRQDSRANASVRRRNLEAAARPLATLAALAHRCLQQFGKQTLHLPAHLRRPCTGTLAVLPIEGPQFEREVRLALPQSDTRVIDVGHATAGGWKSTQTLTQCYQQPDEATILAVVLGGAELRSRRR